MGLKIKTDARGNPVLGAISSPSFDTPIPQVQSIGSLAQRAQFHPLHFSTHSPRSTPGPPSFVAEFGDLFRQQPQQELATLFNDSDRNLALNSLNQQIQDQLPEINVDEVSAVLNQEPRRQIYEPTIAASNDPSRRFQTTQATRSGQIGATRKNIGNLQNFIPSSNNSDSARSVSNLVSQYPQKEKIEGHNFHITIPTDSPKLVVSMEGNWKRIHTVNDSPMTIIVSYGLNMEQLVQALLRTLVVYNSEGESTNPVHPCRNHQNIDHPEHIFLLSGESRVIWETLPHPSILITPHEDNTCLQLSILCRNSCLTRKDLALIFQLELEGQVVARESFLLKVSACPRRDAKPKKGVHFPLGVPGPSGRNKRKLAWPDYESISKMIRLKRENPDEEGTQEEPGDKVSPDICSLSVIAEEAKRSAHLAVMDMAFKARYPEEYATETSNFNQLWEQLMKR